MELVETYDDCLIITYLRSAMNVLDGCEVSSEDSSE